MNQPRRRFIILGAGGHARVVLAAIRACEDSIAGCVATMRPSSHWPAEIPWLGDDEILTTLDAGDVVCANGVGSVKDTNVRRRVYERARSAGFDFPSLVHPSAIVDASVWLDAGVQVMAGAILQTGVHIGKNALVNTGARIDHDVRIGAHAHVAPGVTLSGDVTIGEGAHVGVGATILQGVTIGANAVVGAGAVVIRDVAPSIIVAGVPAMPLRQRTVK